MRAFWSYLREHLHVDARVLHCSPEHGFRKRLESRQREYVTVDLARVDVDVRSSLCELPFEDGRFDRVLCCDVLEHIDDDRSAMRELLRVLAPGGIAWVRVPIRGEQTLEDPSVQDPEERDRLFGQPDHVRFYGLDIRDRLSEAGFEVTIVWLPGDLDVSSEELAKGGLGPDEALFVCRRPGLRSVTTA